MTSSIISFSSWFIICNSILPHVSGNFTNFTGKGSNFIFFPASAYVSFAMSVHYNDPPRFLNYPCVISLTVNSPRAFQSLNSITSSISYANLYRPKRWGQCTPSLKLWGTCSVVTSYCASEHYLAYIQHTCGNDRAALVPPAFY